MKTVILAGGLGSRLSEETNLKPKPMIEIGGMPILWHIMKIYYGFGHKDFIICLGYKGNYIKEFFANYFLHSSDVIFDFSNDEIAYLNKPCEDWRVTLIDTGLHSMTGGRLKRVKDYLDDQSFLMTYGDGVGNIDINASIEFHKKHGRSATMTVSAPPGRFGAPDVASDGGVRSFVEKPRGENSLVNAGFFVLEPKVIDYIADDATIWEQEPMEKLAEDGELFAYQHHGFWHPMDTLRDKNLLEGYWKSGNPEWRIWN